MSDCDICSASHNDPGGVFDSEYWYINLSRDQRFLGRCYITLKQHKANLSKLSSEEWVELHEIIKKLEVKMKNAFSPTMFNWACLMNDAYFENENPSPHVHFHCIPRYKVSPEVNGKTFSDPVFGQHYKLAETTHPKTPISDEEYFGILEKLRV